MNNNEAKELVRSTLSKEAYFQVNKKLLKATSIDAAILLADLISKENYFERKNQLDDKGRFFNTQNNIEEDTTLSPYQQRNAIHLLKEKGFIETTREGLPAHTVIKILHNCILSFLISTDENTAQHNKNKDNKNKVNKGSKEPNKDSEDTESNSPLNISPFIEEWNKYPLLTKHTSSLAKVYQEGHKLCTYLINGSLGRHCNISREFLEQNNIPVAMQTKKFTEEEVFTGIELFSRMFQEGYWPENKKLLPKSLADFIYNPRTQSSFFLKVMANEPQLLQKTKDICPSISVLYEELYKGRLHTSTDRNNFIFQTNLIKKNYDAIKHTIDMTETLDSGCDSYFGTVEKFAEQHIRWMRDYYKSHLQIGSISKSWFKFLDYVKDYYHYDFDPSEEKLIKMEKECNFIEVERENRRKIRDVAKHREEMEFA